MQRGIESGDDCCEIGPAELVGSHRNRDKDDVSSRQRAMFPIVGACWDIAATCVGRQLSLGFAMIFRPAQCLLPDGYIITGIIQCGLVGSTLLRCYDARDVIATKEDVAQSRGNSFVLDDVCHFLDHERWPRSPCVGDMEREDALVSSKWHGNNSVVGQSATTEHCLQFRFPTFGDGTLQFRSC